jgi:hypothetical protein
MYCRFTIFSLVSSVDPTNDDRIAGHSESQVVIWDRRNFEKPIVTINTMQQVGILITTKNWRFKGFF